MEDPRPARLVRCSGRASRWPARRARRRMFNRAVADFASPPSSPGAPARSAPPARPGLAQRVVEVRGQADVGVIGVGALSPYSVDWVTNPILAAWSGLAAHLRRRTPARPFVREGGALIALPSARRRFLAAAPPFVRRLLRRGARPRRRIRRRSRPAVEDRFVKDPWYVHLYRTSQAYPRRAPAAPLVRDRRPPASTAPTSSGSVPTGPAPSGWASGRRRPWPMRWRSCPRPSAGRSPTISVPARPAAGRGRDGGLAVSGSWPPVAPTAAGASGHAAGRCAASGPRPGHRDRADGCAASAAGTGALRQIGGVRPLLRRQVAWRCTAWTSSEGSTEPAVLVANHASPLDTAVLLAALPEPRAPHALVAAADEPPPGLWRRADHPPRRSRPRTATRPRGGRRAQLDLLAAGRNGRRVPRRAHLTGRVRWRRADDRRGAGRHGRGPDHPGRYPGQLLRDPTGRQTRP